MLQTIRKYWRRLGRDEAGQIFILFGASVIPIMLLIGGALDVSRLTRHKMDLANAIDAAALALARKGQHYEVEEAKTFVESYIAALGVESEQFVVDDIGIEKTQDGFLVSAVGEMETSFLPLGGILTGGASLDAMAVNITAQVVHSSNRVELALVFDNTGSMTQYAGSNPCGVGTDRMSGLKCAASLLVDDLMLELNDGDGDDQLKVALVPFEGAVNVGADPSNPPAWIDWSDQAKATYTGINVNTKDFGGAIGEARVGHKWLYDKLGIAWAGCVEMRAEPYDLLDTPPDPTNPATLFVPMFWPDEPDTSSDYWNNYLNDGVSGSGAERQLSLTKYDKASPSGISWVSSSRKDTTFPYSYGPNRGCPRPLTPLTSDETTIDNAIAAMQPQGATGTFIANGLIWGWHVLSPTEPFTEGLGPDDEYYDKTIKAVVLLTDGANSPSIAVTGSDNHNESTYSGYNYPGTEIDHVVGGQHYYRRLQAVNVDSDPSDSTATSILNSKTSSLCENVRGAGVRLYTITFGSMNATTTNLMTNCASLDEDGSRLYFAAPDSEELENIFRAIGRDLSEIHLSM